MTAASETPELLLQLHLKKLRLPSVLREYEKLAQQCAAENVDHVRYLARLIELELIDREARMVDRRAPRPSDPPRPHPGNEWPILPTGAKPSEVKTLIQDQDQIGQGPQSGPFSYQPQLAGFCANILARFKADIDSPRDANMSA